MQLKNWDDEGAKTMEAREPDRRTRLDVEKQPIAHSNGNAVYPSNNADIVNSWIAGLHLKSALKLVGVNDLGNIYAGKLHII